MTSLKKQIQNAIAESRIPRVSVAYRNLLTGEEIMLDADSPYHAASTMKVPIMAAIYRLRDEGKLKLDDPIQIINEFPSLVNQEPFQVTKEDDSEFELYDLIGKQTSIRDLIERMITKSSNLATNILVELIKSKGVMEYANREGFVVKRGVEDSAAYRQGLNNTVTACAYCDLLTNLTTSDEEMTQTLQKQTHRVGIPSGLPSGSKAASKPGWTSQVVHDGAIVYQGNTPSFILCILTEGADSQQQAQVLMRQIAEIGSRKS